MKNPFKIKNINDFNLIEFATPIIDLMAPIKFSPNQKYNNSYFLLCIFDFITSGTSWTTI
jgi:hypothetical protein